MRGHIGKVLKEVSSPLERGASRAGVGGFKQGAGRAITSRRCVWERKTGKTLGRGWQRKKEKER